MSYEITISDWGTSSNVVYIDGETLSASIVLMPNTYKSVTIKNTKTSEELGYFDSPFLGEWDMDKLKMDLFAVCRDENTPMASIILGIIQHGI